MTGKPNKGGLCIQVCALNGYSCVDTEYAWYQQQQQQQQHKSPYTNVLIADCADRDDDSDKTTFFYPATPVDYCPSCVALCAAEVDTAAAVSATSDAEING